LRPKFLFARIADALREEEAAWSAQVAIVWLLLFTGARAGEINDLQWGWVQPPRLMLPDSNTGAGSHPDMRAV
jgi:integrase